MSESKLHTAEDDDYLETDNEYTFDEIVDNPDTTQDECIRLIAKDLHAIKKLLFAFAALFAVSLAIVIIALIVGMIA